VFQCKRAQMSDGCRKRRAFRFADWYVNQTTVVPWKAADRADDITTKREAVHVHVGVSTNLRLTAGMVTAGPAAPHEHVP
jgi:hypothetical protein